MKKLLFVNIFVIFLFMSSIKCDALTIDGRNIDGSYGMYDYTLNLNQEYLVKLARGESCSFYYNSPLRLTNGTIMIYDICTTYEIVEYNNNTYDFDVLETCTGLELNDLNLGDDGSINPYQATYNKNTSFSTADDNYDDKILWISNSGYESLENKLTTVLYTTFKIKIVTEDKAPYEKIPATWIEIPSKKNIAVGFSKKLKIEYDDEGEYLGKIKWSSSNKKVATVNSKGVVKAKKKGKCTITCKLPNGVKAKCKITVKKNEYKGKSLSKCDAYAGRYGNIHFEVNRAYYKGNQFILKCVVMNTRIFRADKFNWITIVAEDDAGNVIAKKKFKNVPINLGRYGKKYITFTFPKNTVKKKRELYNGVWIDPDYNYQYSY